MRYFKERGIKYQFIDMNEKGMSRGEFTSVKQAVGGLEAMIDEECRDKELLTLIKYIDDSQKEEKIFENQHLIKMPVTRNGKKATVGYFPDKWKEWE